MPAHSRSFVINVECPSCGTVRDVKTNNLSYPRIKNCQQCARRIVTENRKATGKPCNRPVPTPRWESDPFTTGQLPVSVTANALWN